MTSLHINPALFFNGNCEEAFDHYQKVLGGEINFKQTWGNSPMAEEAGKDWHDKIIHVELDTNDTSLMGTDMPDHWFEKPQGMSVSINCPDPDRARKLYDELSQDAIKIIVPFEKAFWGALFGQFVDRFGTPWMINCMLDEQAGSDS